MLLASCLANVRNSNDVMSTGRLNHDEAIAALERSFPDEQVSMHCEVQVAIASLVSVRHAMDEVYRVLRNRSGDLLYADVAKTSTGGDEHLAAGSDVIYAAEHGQILTVKRLLEAKADPNQRRQGAVGEPTALYMSAQNGHLSCVVAILKHRADPNMVRTDNGTCPVAICSSKGHVEVLHALLSNNANPNSLTQTLGSPLYLASKEGHLDVVNTLLHAGARPNFGIAAVWATPLSAAATKGNLSIVNVRHAIPPAFSEIERI